MHPENKHYRWQNDIYNKFISRNALCEANAKSLEELKLSSDSMLRDLIATGVVIQVRERYYLNEEKAIRHFRRQSLTISAFVIVFLLLLLIGYLTLT